MATIGTLHHLSTNGNVPCNTCEIEWKVENFFSLGNDGGIIYYSPTFSFLDKLWFLTMYPNGLKSLQSSGCIGLYLMSGSIDRPTSLDYTLGLKTFDGKKDPEHHCVHIFSGCGQMCGARNCITRDELKERKSDLMPNDVLTIFCNLKYPDTVKPSSEKCVPVPPTSFQKKILKDLKAMFLKKQNCDVVLSVKGQEFPAHKAILAARSAVLESMFESDMIEKATNNVNIEDCEPSSFPDFLCFLYCEDVELSQANVFSLYTAADKYDVPDLRSKCVDFMKENLSVDFFCETITLALKHSETELVNSASEFFVKNAKKIVTTTKWQTFIDENPTESNELFIKFIDSVGA